MNLPTRPRPPCGPLRLCRPRTLRTLGILLTCLPLAAILVVGGDRVLQARRRTRGGQNPIEGSPMSSSMQQMMFRASRPGLARGEEAPDFTLPDASGRPVTLSSFRGKRPVVLVFGSFGCDLFCASLVRLRRLRDAWKGRAEFLFVYVSEGPHKSTPLPQAASPMPPATGAGAPLKRVRWYEGETGGGLCWLFDGEDKRMEDVYNAWPRRLLIVGSDGRVAFDAGNGIGAPWDLDEVEREIRAALAHPEHLH